MSITEKLPPDYRFTEKDFNKAWEIFSREGVMTEDEAEFEHLADVASQMHAKSGVYPTLAETVTEHLRLEEEYAAKPARKE